jgi:hypothetical protein
MTSKLMCSTSPVSLSRRARITLGRNSLNPPVRFRVQGKRQVEPSEPQAAHDGLDLLDRAEDALNTGMPLPKPPERGRHQLGGSRLGHADADACPLTAASGADVGADGFRLAEGTTSPPVEPHRRQLVPRPAAAGPGEQLRIEHGSSEAIWCEMEDWAYPNSERHGGNGRGRQSRGALSARAGRPLINRPDRSLCHQLPARNVDAK